jgi:hypothetical protein
MQALGGWLALRWSDLLTFAKEKERSERCESADLPAFFGVEGLHYQAKGQ